MHWFNDLLFILMLIVILPELQQGSEEGFPFTEDVLTLSRKTLFIDMLKILFFSYRLRLLAPVIPTTLAKCLITDKQPWQSSCSVCVMASQRCTHHGEISSGTADLWTSNLYILSNISCIFLEMIEFLWPICYKRALDVGIYPMSSAVKTN